jgi:hypothetical protein
MPVAQAERGENPRQGLTKRVGFGPPKAARSVSAANHPLYHRHIPRESLNASSGFFVVRRTGANPAARKVRRSFQQSEHRLSGRTGT